MSTVLWHRYWSCLVITKANDISCWDSISLGLALAAVTEDLSYTIVLSAFGNDMVFCQTLFDKQINNMVLGPEYNCKSATTSRHDLFAALSRPVRAILETVLWKAISDQLICHSAWWCY